MSLLVILFTVFVVGVRSVAMCMIINSRVYCICMSLSYKCLKQFKSLSNAVGTGICDNLQWTILLNLKLRLLRRELFFTPTVT